MENNPPNLIRCPYNPHHQVKISRLQKHVYKCAKQYPNIKLDQCPYNVTHYAKSEELEEHKKTCPDQWKFEKFLIESASPHIFKNTVNVKMPKYEVEESWDHFNNLKSYDPEEHCNEHPVIRTCHGKSKKERRAFYVKDQERIEKIKKTKPFLF